MYMISVWSAVSHRQIQQSVVEALHSMHEGDIPGECAEGEFLMLISHAPPQPRAGQSSCMTPADREIEKDTKQQARGRIHLRIPVGTPLRIRVCTACRDVQHTEMYSIPRCTACRDDT
jgi:hypothetical protein